MESFASLRFRHWRQFEEIDLDLSPSLCVLTGPNGCGKTTILNVLGKHFGWNLNFLMAPFLSKATKRNLYADAWDALDQEAPSGNNEVGSISYLSGAVAKLTAPTLERSRYQLSYHGQLPVVGLHIPSHRPPPSYHQIQHIPIDPKTNQQHYQEYQNFLYATYGEHSARNPVAAMKESIIAFAVLGEGNSAVQGNPDYRQTFEAFQEILRRLTPGNIGFEALEIRVPDVVIRTKSGSFPLEAMSGGINALVGIAWQIHIYGFDKEACTVLIDEPENHLHPSMQRELLPRLCNAFPSYRFVVASHSPFIVASQPGAAVYALIYNQNQRVVSQRLDEADLAGSPNDVLREILDVPVTMPIWVEDRIRGVLEKFAGQEIDADTIRRIRNEMEHQGLGEALGEFLTHPAAGEAASE